MAVVLSSEESDFFSSSSLRRSHSQPKFNTNSSHGFHASASTSRLQDGYSEAYRQPLSIASPDSSPSSAPSSPRTIHAESVDPSYSSTPATNLSLDGHCDGDEDLEAEDELMLPSYEDARFYTPSDYADQQPDTTPNGALTAASSSDSTATSVPETPELEEHAEDDTAVRQHPTQHVDYLSHDWKEEDIWSSWRYIVSKRGEYTNGSRLENASWRTWMKNKYKLKTITPETLNWLKDCDVTWLYGPLQTHQTDIFGGEAEHGSSTLSRSDSFVSKKPILKKRSMSEVMLQRSISTSSLLKQAAASIEAQQQNGAAPFPRPILHRATTDYITFPFNSRRLSRETTSVLASTDSSGVISPSTERKHIHFDEQVKQCIAVEVKGDDEDDEEAYQAKWRQSEDSDSDDGAIMIKTKTNKRRTTWRKKAKTSSTSESKTIAMLPSTTLKYREDTPEPRETAMKHSTGRRSPLLSPSASQETLRPSKKSGGFFVGDEDDDEDDDSDDDHESRNLTPISSPTDLISSRQSTLQRTTSTASLAAEPMGMRRTESGMLMPYEEGEGQPNDGLIGRVIDTVNTARDIAHVIWNVGWKR